MTQRADCDPTLYFIAWDGDEITGLVFNQYLNNKGWVTPLSVRRPWRRRGIGLALLHQSFGEFYRRGTPKVALYVDSENQSGATHLYERAGMHVVQLHHNYEKELRHGVER